MVYCLGWIEYHIVFQLVDRCGETNGANYRCLLIECHIVFQLVDGCGETNWEKYPCLLIGYGYILLFVE